MSLCVCLHICVYLHTALIVYLLYNILHDKQMTSRDCEILKDRISTKILSAASDTKPISLSCERKIDGLETGLCSDVASQRAQFALSLFWLPFLSLCCRFTLRFNSSGKWKCSSLSPQVWLSSKVRPEWLFPDTAFVGDGRMGCMECLGLHHSSIPGADGIQADPRGQGLGIEKGVIFRRKLV